MYEREMLCEANLLSAFALMIGGALGTGLPMALLIIWLCSLTLLALSYSRSNGVVRFERARGVARDASLVMG